MIWDFSGNVGEWAYDDPASLSPGGTVEPGWRQYSTVSATVRKVFGPSDATWTAAKGIGRLNGGSQGGGMLRSGKWNSSQCAGLFCANLAEAAATESDHYGFRCVYNP